MNSVSLPYNFEVVVQNPVLCTGARTGSRQQAMIHARPELKRARKCVLGLHRESGEGYVEQVRAEKRHKNPHDDMKTGSTAAGKGVPASDGVRLDRRRPRGSGAHSRRDAVIPTPISSSGIDVLISGYGLLPHDLSAMTAIYHGSVAVEMIRLEPARFSGLIKHSTGTKDSSYFAYIGPRFGSSPCLDSALRCLFSKMRSILVPTSTIPEAVILTQYDQALASLQTAVNSPHWSDPEVLCATSILALFELFNSPTFASWSHHVAGAARLIQLRGPESFKSDFDKALLKAIYPCIGTECMRLCVTCFFEEEPWQKFLAEAYPSDEPLAENGRMMRDYAVDVVKIPGLQEHLLDAMNRGLDMTTDEVKALTERGRYLNKKSREWIGNFTQHLAECKYMGPKEYDSYMSQFAAGVTFHVLSCMLLAAMDPILRLSLIEEAEAYARELRKAKGELAPLQHGPAFWVAQKANLSDAALVTAPIWKEGAGSGGLIERWRFLIWCKAITKCHSSNITLLDEIPQREATTYQTDNGVSLVKFGFGLLTLDKRLH